MLEYNRFLQRKIAFLTRTAALVLAVIIAVLLLAQTAFAKSTYLINDGDRVFVHTTYATDPADILDEAGLPLGKDDTYITQTLQGVSEITVQRQQLITILHGNQTLEITSYGESVESLLNRANLVLDWGDVLSVSLDASTYDGMVITISRSITSEETYSTVIPHETEYCYDASLPEGQQTVLTQGVDGQLLCSATVHYVNGVESSRVINSQVVVRQPINEVVAIGTYVEQSKPQPMPVEPDPSIPENLFAGSMPVVSNGVLITDSGEVLTYTQKLDCVATAYSCDGKPGITYSGTPARVGAIAVDPTFIPLGTRMYIVTNDGDYIYGIATAEDIGGAVKGNIVDLYFNTFAECYQFGRRPCTVYILG